MELKSKTVIPPGGWYYIQPETKLRIEADDYETLINRVIQHREYKKIIPIDRIVVCKEVDHQICVRVGYDSEYVKVA